MAIVNKDTQIKSALKKIGDALSSGRKEEILKLSNGKISIASLYNWINNPEKIQSKNKFEILVELAGNIYNDSNEKRTLAYRSMLGELRVQQESQYNLKEYKGIYNIHHLSDVIEIGNVLIGYDNQPQSVYFYFRYLTPTGNGHCDGLIYCRNGKFIMSGISNTCSFHAVFQEVVVPHKNYITGVINFLDFNLGENFVSKAVLLHQSVSEDSNLIDSYLQK